MAVVDQIIGAESSGDPYARNSRSSAGGLGQFTDSTWLDMMKRYRPDLAGGMTDAQLLQLKFDPNLSREMTQAYADQNSAFLRSKGIDPTPGNTYLAHFAGPGGAAAIHADPGATVEALLGPRAVAANPFLRGKTGQDVIDWANRKMTPAQHMAKNLRQRYASEPKETMPAQTGATGMDRLKSALSGKGYDPEQISTGQTLQKRGQEIGSSATNWLGALGGTLVSGIGGAIEGQEAADKKTYQSELREGLSTSPDAMSAARLLMASPDPQQQAAGIDLFSKISTAQAKAKGEEFGTSAHYYRDPETGDIRVGQLSKSGGMRAVDVPGKVLPPFKTVDLGTSEAVLGPGAQPLSDPLEKDVAGAESEKAVGKGQGEAQVNLPDVEGAAQRILRQIDAVESDPNLPNVTGWESWLPTISSWSEDTEKRIQQLHGSAFLQAFQDVKGGGAITEAEGSKATEAYARLATAQSDEGFLQALRDFKFEVQELVKLARRKAGVSEPQPAGGNVDNLKRKYGLE